MPIFSDGMGGGYKKGKSPSRKNTVNAMKPYKKKGRKGAGRKK